MPQRYLSTYHLYNIMRSSIHTANEIKLNMTHPFYVLWSLPQDRVGYHYHFVMNVT